MNSKTQTLFNTPYQLTQSSDNTFNIDSLLLAHFMWVPARAKKVLDVGTGNGVLMLYLSLKTKAIVYGVEIQTKRYLEAYHNIVSNTLEDRLICMNQDFLSCELKGLDVVVGNPPFFKVHEKSKQNKESIVTKARHETELTLEDFIHKSSQVLKQGGLLFFIHRPDRFEEIVSLCNRYQLAIKRVQWVHPYLNKHANHILIEAKKQASPGLIVLEPFILYEDKHVLTKQAEALYK